MGDYFYMKYILSFLLLFPSFSFAKTIFEPALGLTTGAFKGEIPANTITPAGETVSVNYTSLAFGARYGITRRYIHVTGVVEGHLINMGSDATDGSTDLQMNYGVGIGYEWNIPLRTYLTVGLPFSSVEVSYYFSETFLVGLRYNRLKMEFGGVNLNVNTFGVAVNFPIEFDYPNHWWRKTDWE